ncbi:MAG: hypothetical protein B6I24_04730 [Bacteroidetes bacterium 4572_128]|nr:MAG: hypothetical protein B6I24_04730 [Bacteroidetes bacterium 4572_128]
MFEHYEYSMAIKHYENFLKKNSDNTEAIRRLAKSYEKVNRPIDAIFLYEILLQSPAAIPEDFLSYAKVLKTNKKYIESQKWFKKYLSFFPKNREVLKEIDIEEIKTLQKKLENKNIKIRNLNINTPFSEFSPAFYAAGHQSLI